MSEIEDLPELSDGARDLLSSYREASPASGRAKGNWAAIQTSLAATAATATAGTAAKAATGSASLIKWVLIGTAILGAGGGAAAWAIRSNDDSAETPNPELATHNEAPPSPGDPTPTVAPTPDPTPESQPGTEAEPKPEPKPKPEAEPQSESKPKPQAEAKPEPKPQPEPKPKPQPKPHPTEADRLAAEAKLVASIQDAVVRKDWKDVERLSNRHAKEHEDGVMSIERKALQTVGRCESGDERGSKGAAAFLEKHGGSPHAAKVKKACGTSND